MKFHTLEEITDKHIGKIGTPARDAFEAEIEAALIGSKIREARKLQKITQRELGERVGVQTAQISKIEKGRNLTISTIVKVLNALDLSASFSIGELAPITLGKKTKASAPNPPARLIANSQFPFFNFQSTSIITYDRYLT